MVNAEPPSDLVAHTPTTPDGKWHSLKGHSSEVADEAMQFTSWFGVAALGFWIGLLHDLGKALRGFQQYLWKCFLASLNGTKPPKSDTPHAAPGAVLAREILLRTRASESLIKALTLTIHAHHSHLKEPGTSRNELKELKATQNLPTSEMWAAFDDARRGLPAKPPLLVMPDVSNRCLELLIRMLLSALVDADRRSTERHDNPERFALRERTVQAKDLLPHLIAHVEAMRNESTTLGRIRHEVFTHCREMGNQPGGIFRLTVPTGGGKTLASLTFALQHLARNDASVRPDGIVVVALPYTSIIEQTTRVYREIPGLGPDNVLEHHSAVLERDDELTSETKRRLEVAVENWDVPIVVTTTVQLLESLFGNRPSKVRKIHRLAGSVIVLDEFQSLPVSLLAPTMDVLRQLATPVADGGYGATIVLCTATQPSLDSPQLRKVLGDLEPKEIVPNYQEHFTALRRVNYEWRSKDTSWTDLAAEIKGRPTSLTVLNTRRDAMALLMELHGAPHLFHLSTLLCGAHRQKVLDDVRDRLNQGLPVTLVSTQVVECGVDISFPFVYRAVGPLDRIVQAAGRCNRNFDGPDRGKVVVFNSAEGSQPRGLYKDATEKTLFVMKGQDPEVLHDPDFHRSYFHKLYNDQNLDEFGIQDLRETLNFPRVAEEYRLIDSPTSPVVVQYGSAWSPALDAHLAHPSRDTWKALQPYIVNLFDFDIKRAGNTIREVGDGLFLSDVSYSRLRGIDLGDGVYDPSDLYIGGS
jgi:CRISPR-associated endonuclease/helicase Cas3